MQKKYLTWKCCQTLALAIYILENVLNLSFTIHFYSSSLNSFFSCHEFVINFVHLR